MMAVMKRAFWDARLDALMRGWEDGTGFAAVFEQVIELMDSVAAMFARAPKAKQDELFAPMVAHCQDMQSAIRNRSYNAASFGTTVRTIVNTLLQEVESPYQHQLTQTKFDEDFYGKLEQSASSGEGGIAKKEEFGPMIIDTLQFMFQKIDVCKAEMKNFKLAMLSPQQKAGNERQAFDKLVQQFAGRHPWLQDFALKK